VWRRFSATRALLVLLSSAALLAAACGDNEDAVGTGADGSSGSPSQTSASLPPGFTPATVTRVVDGDTIEVEIEGQQFKVRYIGIDTPESVDPRTPVECFGKEASQRNRELVEGQTVGLEKDISNTDGFGRLLRYVWLDGRLVNARLVSEGYALAATYPPDVRYSELFAQLQGEAREAGLGLWGAACETVTPSPAAATPPGSIACEYSNTSEPKIKGNISLRTGEMIYHLPGGAFYADTVIDEGDGERWFCTEAEAVSAGWRRSMR